MEKQEAIKKLKALKDYGIHLLSDLLVDKEKMWESVQEALNMAIDALKERAKDKGTWRHFEGELECSKCGARFFDEIMDLCGDDVPAYCPSCGDCKLEVDWSGLDDDNVRSDKES